MSQRNWVCRTTERFQAIDAGNMTLTQEQIEGENCPICFKPLLYNGCGPQFISWRSKRRSGPLKDCCKEYISDSIDIIREWTDELAGASWPGSSTWARCITDQAALVEFILDGDQCPWHDLLDSFQNYRNVMAAMKGQELR